MKIREDITVGTNNEAGSFAQDRLKTARVSPRIIFVGRTLKEQVVKGRGFGAIVLFGHFDDDDARRYYLKNFCESIV